MSGYLIQGIGFLGAALFIFSYQLRSSRALFFCQFVGCVLFCAQFFLIGSWGGALSESFALASILVSILRFGWKNSGEGSDA